MNIRTKLSAMPPRTKAGLAVALLALAVAVWALVASDAEERPAARGGDTAQTMEGMPGMGGDAAAGIISVSPDQLRTFGITFGTVEERALAEPIRAAGILVFDETRLAAVTPRFGGYVERLYIDFTGQPVRAGQPMVEIYSPELVAAQEELLLAARLERTMGESSVPGLPARTSELVRAARQRLRYLGISEPQIDRILATGSASRTLTLHAPASGVVVAKNVLSGQAVQAGEALYTIADLSEVWVEAELREAEAGAVREGTPATVEFASLPGRPISGTVEYVSPTLQPEARTLRVRIAIPNPDGRLRPGMYATVRFAASARTALTVPTSAVLRTGERRIAFVDLGDGRFMPREIETGRVAGELTEVLAGLEAGERVVTSAQYLLDSESNLAEVMKAMMAQMSEPAAPAEDMTGMEGMDMSGDD